MKDKSAKTLESYLILSVKVLSHPGRLEAGGLSWGNWTCSYDPEDVSPVTQMALISGTFPTFLGSKETFWMRDETSLRSPSHIHFFPLIFGENAPASSGDKAFS